MNDLIFIDNLEKNLEYNVKDSGKKTFIIFLSDGVDQSGEVKIIINKLNVEVQILGIIFGYGKQIINLFTLQDHLKPSGISDLFIKSVLFDESKLYYRGLIKIEKNAQKSNAYQKNQNLLMSKSAWADSRPYLEILANDVRCTHGATIGKINEEQLYYLASRGLGLKQATQLLLAGFFREITDRVPDEKIREKLNSQIELKLESLLNNKY